MSRSVHAGHDVNVPATNPWPEAAQPVNRRDVLNALILTSAGPVPASLLAGSLSAPALPQRDDLDNTPQFQAAIDALRRAGGGTLFVPPGTYRIRELRITSSVSLVGLGHAAFKLFDPGRDGYLARIIGQSAISIRNLRFNCTVEAGRENTVGCLEVTFNGEVASSNIAISDCIFANAQNSAWLILRKADNVFIENCEFLDHLRETPGGTHGLSIAESSSAVRVVDCRFDHPSGYRSQYLSRGHIGIDRATDIWIERCILRRAPLNGITIEDNEESLSQSVTIRDCAIRDCGNSAVQIEGNGLVNLSVHNCDIATNGSYGIRLASGKDLTAHITSCNFTDNGCGDLTSGSSQLHINLKPAHIAIVQNCVFKSSSKDSNFSHIFYLNGEVSVAGCSFVGLVNGFGIYSPIDREKQFQRMTATFENLRFIGVGTATFNIPQHSGCSWQYGKREQQSIETLLSKAFACNRDYPAIDIWTPVHARTDAGEMSISINALTGGSMGAKAMHFDLTVERTTDGSIKISPVARREDASSKGADSQSYSMQIVANSVVEEHAFRSQLTIRVIADTASCTSDVSVSLLIKVIWNGFSSSPIFI